MGNNIVVVQRDTTTTHNKILSWASHILRTYRLFYYVVSFFINFIYAVLALLNSFHIMVQTLKRWGLLILFEIRRSSHRTPRNLCQLLNQLLLCRNANKKITCFYFTHTFFFLHWFYSFFQWISGFILKKNPKYRN